MRGCPLRDARVLNTRSLCYRLCKRQRRNHSTNKDNSCSSHGFPFIALTFPGCFATYVPFGCLDSPDTTPKITVAAGQRPWRRLILEETDKITRNACNSCRITQNPPASVCSPVSLSLRQRSHARQHASALSHRKLLRAFRA